MEQQSNQAQLPDLLEKITNYGCWCQLRNTEVDGVVPGRGVPVDSLDELCRSWQQCIACVVQDECDWDSGIPYEIGFDPVENQVHCRSSAEGCSRNTCLVCKKKYGCSQLFQTFSVMSNWLVDWVKTLTYWMRHLPR